jgi:hypothetical protein
MKVVRIFLLFDALADVFFLFCFQFIFGVFLGLVAIVWPAPINNKLDEMKPIVRSISVNSPDGSYSYR